MGESLDYPDVLQEIRGAMNHGRLKLQSNNIIFKNMKTGKLDQMASADVEKVTWLLRARGQCLKVALNNGSVHRFDGFKDTEFDKLASFFERHFNLKLEKQERSIKGWNWGSAFFQASTLDFHVDGKTAFEIPLVNVSHSNTAKNEVTLEFHQNDDAAVSLMEVRFHIPTDSNPENDSVQEFYTNVMSKADIIQATGDAIATFSEIQCLTPRGRYDIKIYPTFLQLHGKTFDYKIPYTTILRLFLLPHRDGRQKFFVVSLDPPIKQGQTRYNFIIVLFNTEDEITLDLGLSEEDIQEKYEGKLTKEMSGPEYEIISRIMKTLVNRKITVPGTYTGKGGSRSIACSCKAATGFLYPLERGFIFVPKPPVHIRFDEVAAVNFGRSSGNTRSFDFDVETRAGLVYNFVGMEKDEYSKLYDFVRHKKLRVKNIGGKLDGGATYREEDMSGSDEEDHDAYLERMKAEGKQREDDDDDDDDDDESDDEDFKPEGSASEPDDEWDSNLSSTSDEDDEDGEGGDPEEKKRRKEEKRLEKEKRAKRKTRTVPEEGTRKKRKTKKDKDPNRPKRPQSAYMLWLSEHREQIKEENPSAGMTDIAKIGGQKWNELKDKTKWEKEAQKLKEKYSEVMEVYKADLKNKPAASSPEGSPADKVKKKSHKAKAPVAKSPVKAGSGGNFKSKEFISDSESEAHGDDSDDDAPLKKKSKKKESSDEEIEEEDEESEAEASEEESDEGSD